MRATPLHPGMVLSFQIDQQPGSSHCWGWSLLVGIGVIVYQTRLPENWAAVLLGILLISLSLYALGLAMASLARSANAVRAVSFAVFFPMMFLLRRHPARAVAPRSACAWWARPCP